MPNEPEKLFDLMDTEVEPTEDQLAKLMHFVGEATRKQSREIQKQDAAASVREDSPESYGG